MILRIAVLFIVNSNSEMQYCAKTSNYVPTCILHSTKEYRNGSGIRIPHLLKCFVEHKKILRTLCQITKSGHSLVRFT